ncbi:predicted protein [Verticillium alfalfae VaMs.102]|uniref:Predicted protein n=1 Tax=Verticillium alfalfae (strain VaMs.102 / ATCC MYA-4576 / FGSC 10136) TaxID=526221 RepID=C9SRM9_VERA1|nr:predicted protein [Verticillium alfalfae VaMs.102]EEY21444.1 predicted protein [Verticillium alfalfae VaMs.102]
MAPSLQILATLAVLGEALAATSKTSVWLPSRTTRAGDNIYASVITAVPEKSSTEYLLACTSVFKSPYPSSCGDFRGVTLTQGPETVKIQFGSETFTCDADDGDVCDINAQATSTATGEGSFTAITIVSGAEKLSGGKKTTTPSAPSATSDSNGVCKRASGKSGSNGGGGSSDSDSSGSNGGSSTKNGKNGCSGAGSLRAELGIVMGVMGGFVGLIAFVL